MQVRLTKEGQKVLGFSPDRIIANVSDDRAFALMQGGYAAPDKGFMALFDGPLPEKKPEMKPKPKPKKETATSKSAKKREKAVKK
jgi:hypothetical protein